MKRNKDEVIATKPLPTKGLALLKDVFFNKFWDLMKLNLLMITSGLFIITIPASVTAGSRIIINMLRHEHYYLLSDYWRYFRKEFFASFGGLLFFLAMAFSAYANYLYLLYFGDSLLGIILVLIGIVIMILFYISGYHYFCLLVFVDLKFSALMKNAWLLAMTGFGKNSLVVIVLMLWLGIHIFGLPFTFLLLPMITFSWPLLLTTYNAYGNIATYVLKKEEEE